MESGRAFVPALVGSLTIGTTFFLSPISGILTDKIGIQMTTFLGGAIASSGMLLSSIFSSKVNYFFLFFIHCPGANWIFSRAVRDASKFCRATECKMWANIDVLKEKIKREVSKGNESLSFTFLLHD